MRYLSHVILVHGITIDPTKVVIIQNWERPRNATDVISFLGLTGYYRKFIKEFSKVATLLKNLIKKNQEQMHMAYDWEKF